MNWPKLDKTHWSPRDYRHIGPVYIRKTLLLTLLAAASLAVLGALGLPRLAWRSGLAQPPVYAYNDPALQTLTGRVQITDADGQVRYIGDVDQGRYTGRGKVYDRSGQLCYDGPLEDGVYQGEDARVYRDGVLVYEGAMAANLYEGQGRRVDPATGLVSQGTFAHGMLEGAGREYDAGGALLREGTFARDLLNGEGREYAADGTLLREGTFVDGLLHGAGKSYTAAGTLRYEGDFFRGVYQGSGRLYDDTAVLLYKGDFVQGEATGTGAVYHPDGQLLYQGLVVKGQPRAVAFLGLSLAELEQAFTRHWVLYTCQGVTAFVYPEFQLMFLTESPVSLVSPAQQDAQTEEQRQQLLDALAGRSPATGENASTESEAADTILDPETDKSAVLITEVLCWGNTLSGAPQPDIADVTVARPADCRDWFAAYAAGREPEGAYVTRLGPLVYRFTPSLTEKNEPVTESTAQSGTVETVTVWNDDKDQTLQYQAARGRDAA